LEFNNIVVGDHEPIYFSKAKTICGSLLIGMSVLTKGNLEIKNNNGNPRLSFFFALKG